LIELFPVLKKRFGVEVFLPKAKALLQIDKGFF